MFAFIQDNHSSTNNNYTIKTKKKKTNISLTLNFHTLFRIHQLFQVMSFIIHISFIWHISLSSFNMEVFLSLLLTFGTLKIVTNVPWFGFVWCFLTIRFRCAQLAEINLEGILCSSLCIIAVHMVYICSITGDGNFGSLVKVKSARLLYLIVNFSTL